MTQLLTGFTITLFSLLVGYSLGKNQTVVPTDVRKQINTIFRRVVPNSEVGSIEPLTQEQLDVINNPRRAAEQEMMANELGKLQRGQA